MFWVGWADMAVRTAILVLDVVAVLKQVRYLPMLAIRYNCLVMAFLVGIVAGPRARVGASLLRRVGAKVGSRRFANLVYGSTKLVVQDLVELRESSYAFPSSSTSLLALMSGVYRVSTLADSSHPVLSASSTSREEMRMRRKAKGYIGKRREASEKSAPLSCRSSESAHTRITPSVGANTSALRLSILRPQNH